MCRHECYAGEQCEKAASCPEARVDLIDYMRRLFRITRADEIERPPCKRQTRKPYDLSVPLCG